MAVSPTLNLPVQIERDLRPWRRNGISLEDLLATRLRAAPLIDAAPNTSCGMVTTVIKKCVPYFLSSEIPGLVSEYGVGSRGKLREFHEMLHAMCKLAAYRLPDVHFIWNVHPWPLLSPVASLIAVSAARGGRLARAANPSLDAVPEMYPGAAAAGPGGWAGKEWVAAAEASADRHAPPGTAPILSLCKTVDAFDVLYPNMYFKTPNFWRSALNGISGAAANYRYERRKPAMWWRGNSGGWGDSRAGECGSTGVQRFSPSC